MNPTLKKLNTRSSAAEIVSIITKHIGNEPQPQHCRQAYEAIRSRCNSRHSEEVAILFNALCSLNDNPEVVDWVSLIHALLAHLQSKESA
jgi:hypothetical protein